MRGASRDGVIVTTGKIANLVYRRYGVRTFGCFARICRRGTGRDERLAGEISRASGDRSCCAAETYATWQGAFFAMFLTSLYAGTSCRPDVISENFRRHACGNGGRNACDGAHSVRVRALWAGGGLSTWANLCRTTCRPVVSCEGC